MEFTAQELAPIAEQMARLCVQKVKEQEKDRNIMELEAGIRRGLKQMGTMVLGSTLSRADSRADKELDCECGGQFGVSAKAGSKA